MTDAEKREKVIQALENCICYPKRCQNCPWDVDGEKCSESFIESLEYPPGLVEDALALLKEQEARVMTWEEIKDGIGIPVWVEYKDNDDWNGYGVPTSDHGSFIMIYGANAYSAHYKHTRSAWRCWTARPTEEQRKAVLWDET